MNDVTAPVAMAAPPGPSDLPASPEAHKELLQLELLGVLRTEVLDLQNFLDCVGFIVPPSIQNCDQGISPGVPDN